MAETNLGNVLKPTGTRTTVNKVGDGWGIAGSHAVADDPKLHRPFSVPGGKSATALRAAATGTDRGRTPDGAG